ncbi:hypothetical protein SAMN04489740_0176 [Arthrobacter alpinus]|uniref:Glycosyltransferase RgtA/B/C/D-like domain-containing protein n=1 Tax=Arthrobacter alpinus TaxID=656366 RepID=A0A1H5E890_9MICC|nr:hypothetical protein [Arthrobacter alpinus]SED87341.1 hypothetical protein SAMN04489740_0176 [Arthrobacter alpinus]
MPIHHFGVRSLPALLIGALGVVAFLTRLLPLLESATLGGFRGYDDGVHYAAGVHLLAGSLPYRDYVLVHPPGIALLMLPFALVGQFAGDSAGVSAARVFFVLIGTLNTVLIGILLKRWGYQAIIAGAGLYAVGSIATIAERSIMLSPVLGACVLAALVALRGCGREPRRAVTVAAVFLGLALCFKLWAVLPILVIGVTVSVRFGPRLLLRFIAVGAAACALVMGPFFMLAPRAMFTDVVLVQVARTDGAAKGLAHRLSDLVGLDAAPGTVFLIAGFGVLCIAATAVAGLSGRRRKPQEWGEEFWWAVLATVIVCALLASASFFDHYPNFAAPYLALCLGVSGGAGAAVISRRQTSNAGHPRRKFSVPEMVATVLSVVLLFPVGARGLVLEPKPLPEVGGANLAAAAAPHDCVFFSYAYMGIMSDSLSRSMEHGCGSIVDVFGAKMVQDLPSNGAGRSLPAGGTVQEMQVDQLNNAKAAVVGAPHAYYGLTTGAIDTLLTQFVLSASSGNFQVWVRR